jgi:hypothetical protein
MKIQGPTLEKLECTGRLVSKTIAVRKRKKMEVLKQRSKVQTGQAREVAITYGKSTTAMEGAPELFVMQL